MLNRQCVWARNTILPMPTVWMMATMPTIASCTVKPQAHNAILPEVDMSARTPSDETRGINIENGPLGFDHKLYVYGSKNGDVRDLHDGDIMMTGDRIRMSIQTSENAHLYLAFCARQKLVAYPKGGIRTQAGVQTIVPQGSTKLVLDGEPGPEVLYVILSHRELSVADPKLAKALAAKRPSDTPMDCKTSLDAEPPKDSSNTVVAIPQTPPLTNVLRGKRVPKKQLPPAHALRGRRSKSVFANPLNLKSGSPGAKGNPTPIVAASPANPPPVPDFERNPGAIVWYSVDAVTDPVDVVAADDDGIAVVRYAFTHIATASTSPPAPEPSARNSPAAVDNRSISFDTPLKNLYGGAQGSHTSDIAINLTELALRYQAQGAYAKAEPLLIRALDIRKKALGPMHPDVAASLNNLAEVYLEQHALAKAMPLLVEALDIREKALGAMHPDVAQSLNNLAVLYQTQGTYAKAEPLYMRALDIRERALGPMHPAVAIGLYSLAVLYQAQGTFKKAEPLYLRALDITEKALGATHPEVATILDGLAMLYKEQGEYAKAEPLLTRALDIYQKPLGTMHPGVAHSLNNLAGLYQDQRAYAKAEPLLVRALDIHEKRLGAMHPDVALSLNNLAVLYTEQGAYAKAEPLLLRALDIRDKMLGAMHPDVANSLNNLAVLYQGQDAYAKAEPLLLRALDIREKALGTMHPDVGQSLNSLATLYQAQGSYGKAEPLVARAAEIREAQLRLDLAQLSKPRKVAVLKLLQKETDKVLSLHADALLSSPRALELALTTILRRKGRGFDALADSQIPALPMRVDAPPSELNAASAAFRAQSEPITIAKIQAALPRGAALVEFARYRRFDPRKARQPWQEERYVAYVLPWKGIPQSVALGEAASIDASVDAVLAATHKGTSVTAAKAALQHLDTLLFEPLRGRLANASHVILSPDAKLNLVAFEALVDAQGHYELERRLMSYVTSGRDLLRLASRRAPRSSATIVVAPDYGSPRSPAHNDPGGFRPLADAATELAELPAYFVEARILTGHQATKAALAATVGPAVLHVSTHGFYAHDAVATPTWSEHSTISGPSGPTPHTPDEPMASQRGIYVGDDARSSLPPSPSSENPTDVLDRAGLALAGANVRSDGIVSVRELASYDWRGTQLVVLSACEPGVGAVPSGEGVYGMRRALMLAGAESQVVSLWNVSDASTRALMRAFYGELARGTGRAEALRRAKLQLLRQPKFAHPYYWAPFIPAGDWTPLASDLFKEQGYDR